MSLNVKAFLEKAGDAKGEIRRFQVPSGSAEVYSFLVDKIADVFHLDPRAFRLSWQDSDGDFVTFSSTLELLEAVNNSADGVLRIFVKPTEDRNTDSSPNNAQSSGGADAGEKVYHPGVVCDGCESGIYGPRFKCVICPDYDLCAICEEKGTHPEHDKFKITHPQNAGGHGGSMPHHFRHFMRHFMKHQQAQAGANPSCPGGASASANTSSSTSSSSTSSSSSSSSSGPGAGRSGGRCGSGGRGRCGGRWRRGCPMGGAGNEEYLKNIGENIQAFLDPFGVDVTYEVRHGDQKQSGQSSSGNQGGNQGNSSGSFGAAFGPGMWQWNMFGGPQGAAPGGSKDGDDAQRKAAEKSAEEAMKQAAEKAAEAAANVAKSAAEAAKKIAEQAAQAFAPADAEMETEIPVTMETAEAIPMPAPPTPTPQAIPMPAPLQPTQAPQATAQPNPQQTAQEPQRNKEASPSGSTDDDWTMLNRGDATDGPAAAPAPAHAQGEGLYPNLKVAQAVEMMKAMGFNDEAGWLTSLLTTTDGDIAQALDRLKLGSDQAGRFN